MGNVNPTETQATTTSTPEPTTREKMLADLETDIQSEEKEASGTETEAKEPENKEASDDDSTPDDDSSSDEDDEKEGEKEGEKPAKKNRYQKMRAKLQASEELVKKYSSERDEAVKYANIYRQRLLALQERYKSITEANKIELNPVEEENFKLKLNNKEQELTKKLEEEQIKERQKEELIAIQRQQTHEFAQEAINISSKFVTDKSQLKQYAAELLKAHAVALRADPDAEMSDTAKIFFAMQKKNNPEAVQHQVNNVPRPLVTKPTGTKPTFKSTRDEALAFLDAELKGE
jgi:hypothetical protein